MNKCTKKRERDIRNLTVASKDIQLEKKTQPKNAPEVPQLHLYKAVLFTLMSTTCPGPRPKTKELHTEEFCCPLQVTKTTAAYRTFIQSGQSPHLTLCSSQ